MEERTNHLPKVSIIILNWNGWKDTIECLESVYQIDYPNYEVIVVDNHSEDDSIEKIKGYCDGKIKVESEFFKYTFINKPIKILECFQADSISSNTIEEFNAITSNEKLILIKNNKNYGFAEGNNVGIKFSLKNLDSNYVLLLNNDTVVDKSFLTQLIKVSSEDPKIGASGPKTYYYNCNGKKNVISFEGGKINFFKGNPSHITNMAHLKVPQEVDYVEGSCILVKKEIIEQIGLLDREYFLYWEETDWCARIKKANYVLLHIPTAKIWHKNSGTPNSTNTYYMARNRFLFMKKNSNNLQMFSFLVYFFLFNFWFKTFVYLFYYKKPKMMVYFIKGTLKGIIILSKSND